ncbi:MAG: cupin domain-containing protein [Cyanobacteria bacterium J06623_7]
MKITHLHHLPLQGVSHNPEITKKVMVAPGDIPHLTNFSQATFAPGQEAIAHAHSDMYEVFFVNAGRGTMIIDGRNCDLTPGVCIAINPGESHEVINTGTENLVLTYFGIVD